MTRTEVFRSWSLGLEAALPGPGRNARLALALAFVLACIAAFALATLFAVQSVRDAQNRGRLQELSDQALRRAELGADYAFIALGELSERAGIACTPQMIAAFRDQIYRRGTVKDIRIVDAGGNTLCSAFPEVLGAGDQSLDLGAAQASRNSEIGLLALQLDGEPALGVSWSLDAGRSLVAVVSTGALLYDVMPAGLRDGGAALVSLSDGQPIASHGKNATVDAAAAGANGPLVFEARSERYPLVAQICVDRHYAAAWNDGIGSAYPFAGGLLGLIFGLLALRGLARPPSPTAELERALAAGEFRPYAQPIFSLSTGEITSCEILMRQVRRDGTVVPPLEFISLAEQTGMIVPMTWQVMDAALRRLQPFMRSHKNFAAGFNISAPHLMSTTFVADLAAHVSAAGVARRQVTIELTERQELGNLSAGSKVVADLKAHGFRIAIDDVGTGHSGLSQIQRLGADVIKIDKLFVDQVVEHSSARSLIAMLARLAHDLDMTTIAEGIETEEQRAALEKLGVDRGQGFLVAPPLPLDDFLALAERRAAPKGEALAA